MSAKTVTAKQVERWGECLIQQDAFGAEEQLRLILRELGLDVEERPWAPPPDRSSRRRR